MLALYRDAYSGLSKNTWLLSVVMLVNRAGTMVIPFMTIYLTQASMGFTLAQASAVIGIAGMGSVCGGFFGGRLTDRFGFHRIQVVTLTGGGFLFILLGQMHSYPWICGCVFLLNVVNDSFRPANSTAIAAYSKEENRTRSYSLNRLAINLGWAIGGAIGGILASINYQLLFWVDGCTNLFAAFLISRFLGAATALPQKEKQPTGTDRGPYRDKVYLWFIGCVILFASSFFQIFSNLPVYYKRTLNMPEYMIGMLMTLNGVIIAFFEMILVFRLQGRRKSLHYISYGAAAVGLSYSLLNILPLSISMAFGCMILFTAGEILAMPFMNSFWVSRTTTATRGQYAGLYTIAWSVAQALGPASGGEIADRAGFRPLWWIVGGLCFLAAIGFRRLKQITPT
jgi:predicted MFS family arabinose efflux permease